MNAAERARSEHAARRSGGCRSIGSAAQAWSRALELTAPITRRPTRTLLSVVEERARDRPEAPALIADVESLSYGALVDRSRQFAAWAREHSVARNDVVCLLMPNRPEYLAVWLGISSVGGIAALLNTSLTGRALAHCINVAAPSHVIVAPEFAGALRDAAGDIAASPRIWVHEGRGGWWPRLELPIAASSADQPEEHGRATIDDIALYIYTSGTTGLPKAARVSHARIMQWTHWFAGLTDARADDRMYNCLPMHHSVGGVVATGAVLAGGGSVVLREKFSASRFWDDVVRWDCTLFQYIGELCRYLLHAPAGQLDAAHRVRLCCGNGLRGDIWERFQTRFAIPQILEFYASTEGNVSLFNVEGRPGAVGRIPGFLAHRFPSAIIRLEAGREDPVRDERGFCVRCAPHEPGEAIGRMLSNTSSVGSRFEGYTNQEASERKILRNVFAQGDAWFRTGDLMRTDEQGYFYFVDRLGDTFRWKGENVATSEVSEVICAFPGVKEANVYGVTIPGTDGRAAMAAISSTHDLDLSALRAYLADRLPRYARPLFLRMSGHMELTGTFKQTKNGFVQEAYNPAMTTDGIYFDHPEQHAFVRVDRALHDAIQSGRFRL
jgi:fatty-acyl-CoA synthase